MNANYIDAQLAMAKLHLSRNELGSAIDRATQAATSDPDSLEARLMLVRTLMVRPEDRPRAEAAMNALLNQRPDEAGVQSLSAQFSIARGDAPKARAAYERALALDPSHLEALSGLVAMDIAEGRPQQARVRLDARLKVTPDDPGVLVMAAKVYEAFADGPKTEALLKNLIRVEPGNLQGYSLWASCTWPSDGCPTRPANTSAWPSAMPDRSRRTRWSGCSIRHRATCRRRFSGSRRPCRSTHARRWPPTTWPGCTRRTPRKKKVLARLVY